MKLKTNLSIVQRLRECEAIVFVRIRRAAAACISISKYMYAHTTFPISIEHTMRSNVMCKRRKDINSFVILSQAVDWELRKQENGLYSFDILIGKSNAWLSLLFPQQCSRTPKHSLCLSVSLHISYSHRLNNNGSHNVKFQLRWKCIFTQNRNLFPCEHTRFAFTHIVCPRTRIPFLECHAIAQQGFSPHMCCVCPCVFELVRTRLLCVRVQALDLLLSVHSFNRSFIGLFISSNHLFIYCQVNFKRCRVSISLKGNDIYLSIYISFYGVL